MRVQWSYPYVDIIYFNKSHWCIRIFNSTGWSFPSVSRINGGRLLFELYRHDGIFEVNPKD